MSNEFAGHSQLPIARAIQYAVLEATTAQVNTIASAIPRQPSASKSLALPFHDRSPRRAISFRTFSSISLCSSLSLMRSTIAFNSSSRIAWTICIREPSSDISSSTTGALKQTPVASHAALQFACPRSGFSLCMNSCSACWELAKRSAATVSSRSASTACRAHASAARIATFLALSRGATVAR